MYLEFTDSWELEKKKPNMSIYKILDNYFKSQSIF